MTLYKCDACGCIVEDSILHTWLELRLILNGASDKIMLCHKCKQRIFKRSTIITTEDIQGIMLKLCKCYIGPILEQKAFAAMQIIDHQLQKGTISLDSIKKIVKDILRGSESIS